MALIFNTGLFAVSLSFRSSLPLLKFPAAVAKLSTRRTTTVFSSLKEADHRNGENEESNSKAPASKRKLSEQSSWEAKDDEGNDYLYVLGKESDNMNIAVGARAGIIDDLFTGNFLGKDSDIVFDYRQKVTRSFDYIQGDYYIAPLFMDKVGKFCTSSGTVKREEQKKEADFSFHLLQYS